MFKPKYAITNYLLLNIKRVINLINDLNDKRFPNVVLLEFEKEARAVSSFASTSIEGNPLPLTEVKKILKSKPIYVRDSEKEILNYNLALQHLNNLMGEKKVKLSLKLILQIQKQITNGLILPFYSGNLRQEPVVVNDPKTRKIIFLPPDFADVLPMISELIDFIDYNQGKIDPLILAGIFHKQMVLIHPFMDGNGRTARLATKVLLAKLGIDTFNLFSFENYYNKNVTRYFQTVGETGNYYDLKDNIDFTLWLEYFTEGIIDELLRIQKLLPTLGKSPKTKLLPHHLKMIKYIEEKGFIKGADYTNLTGRAKATRALDFKKLINLGLIERKGKGRAVYYILKQIT